MLNFGRVQGNHWFPDVGFAEANGGSSRFGRDSVAGWLSGTSAQRCRGGPF